MKKFPVTIVDNFYDDPDFVRNFALSLEYTTDGDGKWPGTRSPFLDLVDEKFFSMFNAKLLSLFFDLEKTEVECSIETSFQKINPFSADKDDIKNSGWVHSDETLFSGVIYLNPDYHLYSGTSVYKFKPGTDKKLIQNTKHLHYSGSDKFNDEEHEIEKRFNNDKFIETIRVENIYNRLVLFEQNIPHGVPTYYTEANEPRLTQVFFVNSLTSTTMFPLIRKRLVGG